MSGQGINIRQEPKQEQNLDTNRLLLQLPSELEKKYVFFCACYFRIWINSFSAVKIEDLAAELKVVIKFDLDITDIP